MNKEYKIYYELGRDIFDFETSCNMIRNKGQKFAKIGGWFCQMYCPYHGLTKDNNKKDDKGYYVYCQKEHK